MNRKQNLKVISSSFNQMKEKKVSERSKNEVKQGKQMKFIWK